MDNETLDIIEPAPTNDVTVTYKYEQPTLGEQAAAAAVGLGLSLAAGAVVLGVGALINWGADKYEQRKVRKARELLESQDNDDQTDN